MATEEAKAKVLGSIPRLYEDRETELTKTRLIDSLLFLIGYDQNYEPLEAAQYVLIVLFGLASTGLLAVLFIFVTLHRRLRSLKKYLPPWGTKVGIGSAHR